MYSPFKLLNWNESNKPIPYLEQYINLFEEYHLKNPRYNTPNEILQFLFTFMTAFY